MIPEEYSKRYFYHFTHMDNLESIITHGLISTNEKKIRGISHVNVANESIQERRSNTRVPCSPYGNIHDYVPFYFAGTNPMLLSVLNRKNIDQPFIIYIVVSVEKLKENNVLFTDASVNTVTLPNIYSDPQFLDRLSWNLIDSKKWGTPSKEDMHSRMAEVLVYKEVPLEWIDRFVVYNEVCEKKIKELFKKKGLKKPKIEYQPFNGTYFYFTKFYFKNRKNETLITGPYMLKSLYEKITIKTIKERAEKQPSNPSFYDIKDALKKIKNNFCIIKELEGIYKLETKNDIHSNSVCEHTKDVANNIEWIDYYEQLDEEDKLIVKLSAYFHDIGKGPKSKWDDGVQPPYADHPADSLKMMYRILVEEFSALSHYEIEKICLLVAYHDLIGDIIEKGRSKKELMDLGLNRNDLLMLVIISLADIKSINSTWFDRVNKKIPAFINRF